MWEQSRRLSGGLPASEVSVNVDDVSNTQLIKNCKKKTIQISQDEKEEKTLTKISTWKDNVHLVNRADVCVDVLKTKSCDLRSRMLHPPWRIIQLVWMRLSRESRPAFFFFLYKHFYWFHSCSRQFNQRQFHFHLYNPMPIPPIPEIFKHFNHSIIYQIGFR